MSPPETANQWDNLPTSMTIDQEFPREVSHGKCGFLFGSVELWGGRQYNGQSCQRQKKEKNPR